MQKVVRCLSVPSDLSVESLIIICDFTEKHLELNDMQVLVQEIIRMSHRDPGPVEFPQ